MSAVGLLVAALRTGPRRGIPDCGGIGARSVGGRGGRVIEVTNLEDAGM